MYSGCVPPVLIPRTVKLHGRIDSFTMRSSAYSWLRRVISGAVAPSQPPPHLDWALLWPAPGHAKGGEHRLGFASILSQSALLLRGTGVRSGLGVNAFKQLHLNIKSNLPPPFWSSALAEPDELYLCAGVEGKGAGEPWPRNCPQLLAAEPRPEQSRGYHTWAGPGGLTSKPVNPLLMGGGTKKKSSCIEILPRVQRICVCLSRWYVVGVRDSRFRRDVSFRR